jgi:hypothetical protein
MSWMVGQTNRWAQEYLVQWPEKRLERIRPAGQKRLEKRPENRPERGFP